MSWPKLVRIARTPARVVIESAEPNEFNERQILRDLNVLCNYQDAAAVRYTTEKQTPGITGVLYIDGDIVPEAAVISVGYVEIFGEKREISKGTKARNPDGTVNYTRLDVI